MNAGKVVTVSKTDITFNGWRGVGYIIIDPNTGAGAYMISGGLSGGYIMVLILVNMLLNLIAKDAAASDENNPVATNSGILNELIATFKDNLTIKCPDGSPAFIDKNLYWSCVVARLTTTHIAAYAAGLALLVVAPHVVKILAIIGLITLAYNDAMECKKQAAICYTRQY